MRSAILAAMFVASCAALSPTPNEAERTKALATCVSEAHCTTRKCLEAAALHCVADSISAGGAGGEAGSGG